MKSFGCLLALILLCGLGTAKADGIDFQFSVQDPDFLPVSPESITDVNFAQPCVTPYVGLGCFYGENASNEFVTSLELTFPNTVSANDPTDIDHLNGQTPNCVIDNVPQSVFGVTNCSLSPDMTTYTLIFSGGAGLAPGGFFVIVEENGPNADAFQNVGLTLVATPEPGSLVLLSTGVAFAGLLLFRRRRAFSAAIG